MAAKEVHGAAFAGLPLANRQSTVCKMIVHPPCMWYSVGAWLTCEKQLTAPREELKWPGGQKTGGLAANKYWAYPDGLYVPLSTCPWEPMAGEHRFSPQRFICPVHRSTRPTQPGEERPAEHQGGRKMSSVTGTVRRDKGILKVGLVCRRQRGLRSPGLACSEHGRVL